MRRSILRIWWGVIAAGNRRADFAEEEGGYIDDDVNLEAFEDVAVRQDREEAKKIQAKVTAAKTARVKANSVIEKVVTSFFGTAKKKGRSPLGEKMVAAGKAKDSKRA